MKKFENNTEYELADDERAALRMTLEECLDNATDAQLEAIHDYAFSIAPVPYSEDADRKRINELFDIINNVLVGVDAGRIPQTVAVASYKALGICLNENLAARMALIDHLNDCTATAYQTGNMSNLEYMAKVVTTIHDLIGDTDMTLTEMILNQKKGEPASDPDVDPWAN